MGCRWVPGLEDGCGDGLCLNVLEGGERLDLPTESTVGSLKWPVHSDSVYQTYESRSHHFLSNVVPSILRLIVVKDLTFR